MLDWIALWLGIGLGYLMAAVMAAGGGYLAFVLGINPINPLSKLFHYLGLCLIGGAIALACVTYGKSIGAADCEAQWKAKNYEATVANLKRDLKAKQIAADAKAQEAQQLAEQKKDADAKINAWQAYASKLSASVAACRRATADDDRRLCDVIGNAARGCRAPR